MLDAIRAFWDSQPCDSVFGEDWQTIRRRRYFILPYIPGWAGFDDWSGKRVLEIGCGIGTDTISFAEKGAQVTAVDLSPVSISHAKFHAEAAGVSDRITFVNTDAAHLIDHLEPQPFDLIYSCGVLHHMVDPDGAIQQIRENYAHSNTVLKMLVYYRYSWVPFALVIRRGKGAFWRMSEIMTDHAEQQRGCPLMRMWSRTEVKKLLKGFRVTKTIIRMMYPYEDFDGIRKVWYFRPIPNFVLGWLEPFIGWHLCVTANFEGTKEPA